MKKNIPESNKTTSLRRQATKNLHKQKGELLKTISVQDTQNLVHELQVHQIELELQNEELRDAQMLLEDARSKYVDLYDFAPVGYFTIDKNGLILEANLTGVDMLGVQKIACMKKPFSNWIYRTDQDIFYLHNKNIVKTNMKQTCELRMLKKDGTIFYARMECLPLLRSKDNDMQIRIAVSDITEHREMETIKHRAYHDMLTGLPNRTLFTDHLNFALAQASRSGTNIAVLYIDLDNFKTINDSLGHSVGDQLLKAVANRLENCLRKSDKVARFGGDEYVVFLPVTTHMDNVVITVRKIISAFQKPFFIDSHQFNVTVSVGISLYPLDGNDVESLLKNADTAMYKAKERGKNGYQLYNSTMQSKAVDIMKVGNRLCQAVKSGELVAHYQPQVTMGNRKMICAEALVRWQHPEMGLLYPDQFIPLAEETGHISIIDEWMLRTVCKQNRMWQDDGYANICIMVNNSGGHFHQPEYEKTITTILKESSMKPEYLGIEITEHTLVREHELSSSRLSRLGNLGIRIAIDDFGTGYSSLSYLKKLPVQILKIDRSFISNLVNDPDDRSIVKAIITMAHNLKLKVVAEGVETEEQRSFLDSIDCDEIQGYLISKPVPAEAFAGFIKAHG